MTTTIVSVSLAAGGFSVSLKTAKATFIPENDFNDLPLSHFPSLTELTVKIQSQAIIRDQFHFRLRISHRIKQTNKKRSVVWSSSTQADSYPPRLKIKICLEQQDWEPLYVIYYFLAGKKKNLSLGRTVNPRITLILFFFFKYGSSNLATWHVCIW